jgi:hypothetical protein
MQLLALNYTYPIIDINHSYSIFIPVLLLLLRKIHYRMELSGLLYMLTKGAE